MNFCVYLGKHCVKSLGLCLEMGRKGHKLSFGLPVMRGNDVSCPQQDVQVP